MRHRVTRSNQQRPKLELDGSRLFSFRHAFKTCLFILYMAAALRPVVILCFNVSHVQTGLKIRFASCDSYFTHHELTMSSLVVTNGFFICAIHGPIYGLVHSTLRIKCVQIMINRAMRQLWRSWACQTNPETSGILENKKYFITLFSAFSVQQMLFVFFFIRGSSKHWNGKAYALK